MFDLKIKDKKHIRGEDTVVKNIKKRSNFNLKKRFFAKYC